MSHNQNEQKRLAALLIDNLTDNEELKQRLPNAGMNVATALAEGRRLYAEAETLISEQHTYTADVNRQWDVIQEKHDPAWKTFCLYRDRAMTVLHERPDLVTLLGIPTRLEHGRPGQLIQMRPFYREALKNAEALALLADVGLTVAKLEAGRDAVAELDALETKAVRKEADKQAATARQDRALELLNEWRIQGWKRADLVTEDAPHLRKALGMKVATRRPRKSTEAEDADLELMEDGEE